MIKLLLYFIIYFSIVLLLSLIKAWATVAKIKKESKKEINNKWVYEILLK